MEANTLNKGHRGLWSVGRNSHCFSLKVRWTQSSRIMFKMVLGFIFLTTQKHFTSAFLLKALVAPSLLAGLWVLLFACISFT